MLRVYGMFVWLEVKLLDIQSVHKVKHPNLISNQMKTIKLAPGKDYTNKGDSWWIRELDHFYENLGFGVGELKSRKQKPL